VGCQFHVLVTLSSRNDPLVSVKQEARRAIGTVCKFWRRQKSLFLRGHWRVKRLRYNNWLVPGDQNVGSADGTHYMKGAIRHQNSSNNTNKTWHPNFLDLNSDPPNAYTARSLPGLTGVHFVTTRNAQCVPRYGRVRVVQQLTINVFRHFKSWTFKQYLKFHFPPHRQHHCSLYKPIDYFSWEKQLLFIRPITWNTNTQFNWKGHFCRALKSKIDPTIYIKAQSVPRSKHTPSRL
jgi:hypothetical protein